MVADNRSKEEEYFLTLIMYKYIAYIQRESYPGKETKIGNLANLANL
jgi:hypothetical protein